MRSEEQHGSSVAGHDVEEMVDLILVVHGNLGPALVTSAILSVKLTTINVGNHYDH